MPANVVFIDRGVKAVPSRGKGMANTGVTNYATMTPLSPASQGVAVNQLGLSWYYNYGPTPGSRARYTIPITDPGPTVLTPGVNFVPMILDASHNNPTELGFLDSYARAAGAVLGPNEPYGEGNMTVTQAVSLYTTLNAQFPPSSGVLIGSPSGFGGAPALAWFNDFFAQLAANSLRCDFFAHHWQQGYTGQSVAAVVLAFTNALSASISAYSSFVPHGFWITESEVFDSTPGGDNAVPVSFIQQCQAQIVPIVNATPVVKNWCWWPLAPNPFSGNIATFNYCNFDGSLTALGRSYRFL